MHAYSLSCVQLLATPWTLAHQDPLYMGFSRQESLSRLPRSPLGDLPNPGIKLESPLSPALQVDSLPSEPSEKPTINCILHSKTVKWHIFLDTYFLQKTKKMLKFTFPFYAVPVNISCAFFFFTRLFGCVCVGGRMLIWSCLCLVKK